MSEKAEWFKKGQESVLRRNKSGCCCIINDDDEIVSVCGAHQDWLERHLTSAMYSDGIRKKVAECLAKMEGHVKNRNYGRALEMRGAVVTLQEVLDEIESTSQSNTLVDGDKLCDFCGLCDFQKQKRKKNSG